MIIKSIQQLLSTFIIRLSKRTTSSQVTHNRLKTSKAIIYGLSMFLRKGLILPIVSVLMRWLNFRRALISIEKLKPSTMSSFKVWDTIIHLSTWSSCSCSHTFVTHLGLHSQALWGWRMLPVRSPKWHDLVSRDSYESSFSNNQNSRQWRQWGSRHLSPCRLQVTKPVKDNEWPNRL
jgi:hypothetical protein